ncbi:MAG: molybdate ABC transporter substrate-binding protein [Xanthobacteraceae bacterium]|nr:molybdate ABC transporter substrate-binding protein [Xanthobacteraceae bacterium]
MTLKTGLLLGAAIGIGMMAQPASAAEIKVLTTGAFKSVVVALVPEFEKATGHKVVVDNGTVGQLQKRVDGGETFDVLVLSPKGIEDYIKSGKIAAGSNARLAKVGVGVMVKEGAPKPDVSTVDAFKQALLKASTVGYIDPASGGSSGIYVAGLLDKLGIADQIKPKAKLQQGGHVSDLVKAGTAEIGIHQISEIVGQAGVTLVGPLPAEIQNYTVYVVGLSTAAKEAEAAKAFIRVLTGPSAAGVLKSKGMEGA